ncbi:spore germination protein, partial [Fictibacillus sp. NRS-1165]|uniref:spore germination protein n=1 Tax=Fictibacillus sp. NRS-1165 TaxID=3144463 RepID=UPI003D204A3A
MPSFFKRGKQVKNNPNKKDGINHNLPEPLNISLSVNLDFINQKTGNSSDIVIRTKKIGTHIQLTTAVLYVEGMVNEQSIQDFLIESMMNNSKDLNALGPQEALEKLAEDVVSLGHVTWVQDWDALFLSLMSGNTIILVDGVKKALNVSTKGGEKRAIEEPSSQVTVRGPRDGFTESLSTNTTLIRKRINSPNLWVESMQIGRVTNTKVAMVYVHGIANDKIVNEVRRRLKAIDIDSILESGYIEQLIEDQTSTTFPTLYHTERPDSVAGNLLEGRVAIIVDGTPFVLLAPAIFIQFFQAVEDYYARFDISTALRFLRILIFFISIIAPATFVAATTFHQEMIPTNLLIAIAAQRETVPFPAFVEAAMMEVTFEILREAGIRLPRAV